MNEAFNILWNPWISRGDDSFAGLAFRLGLLVLWLILWLAPVAAIFYGIFYLISLPLRRKERARFFLNIVGTSLARGESPEHAIINASASRDRALGIQFHLLAAYLESGLPLVEALRSVPGFLPSQVVSMLEVGKETGKLPEILSASRRFIHDGVSQVRSGMNYLLFLVLLAPGIPIVLGVLSVFVFPKLQALFADLASSQSVPWLARMVFEHSIWLIWIPFIFSFAVVLAAICYLGGPRLSRWTSKVFGDLPDRLSCAVPWRRKRLERDFSLVLALLLDAGIPEPEALTLAARSTANRVWIGRIDRALAHLAQGATLIEALGGLDQSEGLRWRLANAAHGRTGLRLALAGWIEALDARAFQQEQTAAQTFTSAMVLFNGAVVAVVAIALFQLLIGICQEGLLW